MTKAAPGHEELAAQEPGAEEPDTQEEFDAAQPGEIEMADFAAEFGLSDLPEPEAIEMPETDPEFRAGFACLVGRPNAGKSTLTNALVGTKVAITSMRPQTTRHNIRGVVNLTQAQLVLVDTPGLHRPRTLLGKRLNDMVRETLADVDVVAFCIPADEKIGPGDRFIARELALLY